MADERLETVKQFLRRTFPTPRVPVLANLLMTGLIVSAIALVFDAPDRRHAGTEYSSASLMQDVRNARAEYIIDLPVFLQKRRMNAELMILDSRTKLAYEGGHIPGAVNLPADSPVVALRELEKKAGNQTEMVVYCDGVSCASSRLLRSRLLMDGYIKVSVYAAGMDEWKGCGLEIVNQQQL